MKVIDLTTENEDIYFQCLEVGSKAIAEAGDHKKIWYRKMENQGIRVKLAEDGEGKIGGMIQYIPIEQELLEGKDLYFVMCIWVLGKYEGSPSFQKRGMGKTLLQAAEEDARSLEAKGMAAWGVSLPFFMRASWYRKQGYEKADKEGIAVLLWKKFTEDAEAPGFVRPKKKPQPVPGQVTVTGFLKGWCPAQNMVFERARRASEELGDRVVFTAYDTSDREIAEEWGISDALYVDGKEVRMGPPPSYEKIRKLIAGRVRRLPRAG